MADRVAALASPAVRERSAEELLQSVQSPISTSPLLHLGSLSDALPQPDAAPPETSAVSEVLPQFDAAPPETPAMPQVPQPDAAPPETPALRCMPVSSTTRSARSARRSSCSDPVCSICLSPVKLRRRQPLQPSPTAQPPPPTPSARGGAFVAPCCKQLFHKNCLERAKASECGAACPLCRSTKTTGLTPKPVFGVAPIAGRSGFVTASAMHARAQAARAAVQRSLAARGLAVPHDYGESPGEVSPGEVTRAPAAATPTTAAYQQALAEGGGV